MMAIQLSRTDDFCFGVVEQQTNKLACCIARTTDNSYFNHIG